MRVESRVEFAQSRVRIEVFDLTDGDLAFLIRRLGEETASNVQSARTVALDLCDTSMTFEGLADAQWISYSHAATGWFMILATWIGLSILAGGRTADDWIKAFVSETPLEPSVRVLRQDADRRATILINIDLSGWPGR